LANQGSEQEMTIDPSEFEPGEDVTHLVERRKKPAGVVVSVRLDPERADALENLAEQVGKTISQVAREALNAYIDRGGRTGAASPMITVSGADVGPISIYGSSAPHTFGAPVQWEEQRQTKELAANKVRDE